jgi:AAA15 family ATPase/GTPase
MLESFEISHFRSFKNLKLSGLRPINIILGQSAAGKTALLEALRLALSAIPETALYLNTALRKLPFFFPQYPTAEQFEQLWRPLFFDFNIKNPIKAVMVNSDNKTASLNIHFDLSKATTLLSHEQSISQSFPSAITPLIFSRRSFGDVESDISVDIEDSTGKLRYTPGQSIEIIPSEFLTTNLQYSDPFASHFSKLSVTNQTNEVIEIVRQHFPFILNLSTEAPVQGQTIGLYAAVKHRQQKMPVSLISSGLNKFISVLIAIRALENGVVLIDEIENGIYYQMFSKFWFSIHEFALKNKVQLFLSTHSLECLNAVSSIIEKHPDDFSLIQLLQDEGKSKGYVIPGTDAAAAIENGIELRR